MKSGGSTILDATKVEDSHWIDEEDMESNINELLEMKRSKGFDTEAKLREYEDMCHTITGGRRKKGGFNFTTELGLGVSLYFKLMWYLAEMFFLFAIISIPSYMLCAGYGKEGFTKISSLPDALARFGPGNIGEATENCRTFSEINRMEENQVITCPFGTIVGFTEVGFMETNCAARTMTKPYDPVGYIGNLFLSAGDAYTESLEKARQEE